MRQVEVMRSKSEAGLRLKWSWGTDRAGRQSLNLSDVLH
jgi:hypothetical protein